MLQSNAANEVNYIQQLNPARAGLQRTNGLLESIGAATITWAQAMSF